MKESKIALLFRLVWLTLLWTFKLAMIALMIATPLLGVWVSSSLAVFANKGVGWAIAAGLLMFPTLPLLWDAWASHRRRKKGLATTTIFNWLDRLVLRTLLVNGLFVGGMLYYQPKMAFTALSARGDWMLGGSQGAAAQTARRTIFAAADTLEWLYTLTQKNPYKKYQDKGEGGKKPEPTPRPADDRSLEEATRARQKEGAATSPKRSLNKPYQANWPQLATIHPLVAKAPPPRGTTASALGTFFKDRIHSERERARAIHDYVAQHIAYDAKSYSQKRYPPQDPPTVLRTQLAVCAGYAKLFEAIAEAAGLEAFYVVGRARQRDGGIDGEGHAWNAVKVDGRWYLLDVTWDAGHVEKDRFTRTLSTSYFLTPPAVFGTNHYPDDTRWQLRKKALSRGEFIRQPMMSPAFYAAGLALLSPKRPQVTVTNGVRIRLVKPPKLFVLAAKWRDGSKSDDGHCHVSKGVEVDIECRFSEAGRYLVHICVNKQRSGNYDCVGKIMVNVAQ